jgi:hypothetical protein
MGALVDFETFVRAGLLLFAFLVAIFGGLLTAFAAGLEIKKAGSPTYWPFALTAAGLCLALIATAFFFAVATAWANA